MTIIWVKNKPEMTKTFDTLEESRPYQDELFRRGEDVKNSWLPSWH